MVLTPQMAISHLVMTIGVGISQKKKIKKFDLVTILWFDPYTIPSPAQSLVQYKMTKPYFGPRANAVPKFSCTNSPGLVKF